MERFIELENELDDLMIKCVNYEFNGLSGKYYDYKWYTFIMQDNTEIQVYTKL